MIQGKPQVKGKCEICKENGYYYHHIIPKILPLGDERTVLLCRKCHAYVHSQLLINAYISMHKENPKLFEEVINNLKWVNKRKKK